MRQHSILRALLLGTLTALSLNAIAAPDAERLQKLNDALNKRFAAADADGNAQLSRDEAKAKMPQIYKSFDAIDTAKQGFITLDQIRQFFVTQAAEKQNGRTH